MKVHFVVIFAFLSIVGASSNLIVNVYSVVQKEFARSFEEFINNGIRTGCDLFASIYFTGTNVTNMIENFASGITAKSREIQTKLPPQVSQILSDFCDPLNYLLGVPNYITCIVNLFNSLANDVVNFLYNLFGKPNQSIHQAFCGDKPGTLTDYFTNLYAIFINRFTPLDSLLYNLLCVL